MAANHAEEGPSIGPESYFHAGGPVRLAQSDPASDRERVGANVTYRVSANGASSANGHTYIPESHQDGPVRDATFAELIGRLVNDGSDLLDKQIELAKQEIREWLGQNLGAAKTMAIGAGIAAAAGLLIVISVWVGFILLLMWLFSLLFNMWGLAWLGSLIGWVLALAIPVAAAVYAVLRIVLPGWKRVRFNPVPRTQATLKENLEWVKALRTPSAR